ncbi:unannotated protein [freshwater metagenome]|uniref:Unannotated protein n=1 Tax=freshwater metagenome TaxID=449393 RepID=A0A6J7VM18_9ZZZZ
MPLDNIEAVHEIAERHSFQSGLADLGELTLVRSGLEKDLETIAK